MSREPHSLTEIFVAYGDDAAAGLVAWANVDNNAWSAYCDEAAEIRYRQDYAKWRRSMVRSAKAEAIEKRSGQVRLFEPAESEAKVHLREKLVLDGEEHQLASITDTGIIRKAAQRDLAPAITTVGRCKTYFALADHMDQESTRLGRPVTAGEVLGWVA